MTTFRYILMQCGMSRKEAAKFLNVSMDSVNSWSSGRRDPPVVVFHKLAALHEKIRDIACEKAEKIINDKMAETDPGFHLRWWNDTSHDFLLPCVGARKAAWSLAMLASQSASD